MKTLSQYIVPFKNLGLGKHILNFKITDEFFEVFPYEDILGANLNLQLTINVQTKGLLLEFYIFGTVRVVCDRCLEEFDMDFETKKTLNVEFSDSFSDDFLDDDTISIKPDEGQIDISKHIFDFIVLGLPIRKVHKDNPDGSPGCNPEMLKFIEQYKPKKNLASTIKGFDKLKDLLN